MIKCNVSREKNCKIKANGTPAEIASEALFIIHSLYDGLRNENVNAADEFRRTLIAAMIDPNGPIFK